MHIARTQVDMLFRLSSVAIGVVKECVAKDSLAFSTAMPLSLNWNKPKNSGDKGPEKNYLKKMKKKQNQNTDMSMNSLLGELKELKSGPGPMDANSSEGDDIR